MNKNEVAAILGVRYDEACGCWWMDIGSGSPSSIEDFQRGLVMMPPGFGMALSLLAFRSMNSLSPFEDEDLEKASWYNPEDQFCLKECCSAKKSNQEK